MRKFLPFLLVFLTMACQTENRSKGPFADLTLVTPRGERIETRIVYSAADQMQGLSGVQPDEFRDDQGMLFYYLADDEKHFWMPDTYFDLDLIYLDKDLLIIDIIRKLPHYIGRANEDLIPRARGVWCRHTLEMKAGSPIAAGLKVGERLTWENKLDLAQSEAYIRQELAQKP